MVENTPAQVTMSYVYDFTTAAYQSTDLQEVILE